jgi:hypothetical protein
MMVISRAYPPNIEAIRKVLNPRKGTIFTYGDTVYAPDTAFLEPPLLAHEEVHQGQQKGYGVERWWDRYLMDAAFRASQEIPAFQVQYREARKSLRDRNALTRYVSQMAEVLSSDMYGNCMTRKEAEDAITLREDIVFRV